MKVIGYDRILHQQFAPWDSKCYRPFKDMLEAKADIKKSQNPRCGYNTLLNAITYIDQYLTNLKYYIGYLKAKELTWKAHKNFHKNTK